MPGEYFKDNDRRFILFRCGGYGCERVMCDMYVSYGEELFESEGVAMIPSLFLKRRYHRYMDPVARISRGMPVANLIIVLFC